MAPKLPGGLLVVGGGVFGNVGRERQVPQDFEQGVNAKVGQEACELCRKEFLLPSAVMLLDPCPRLCMRIEHLLIESYFEVNSIVGSEFPGICQKALARPTSDVSEEQAYEEPDIFLSELSESGDPWRWINSLLFEGDA
ncbi:hypothetical protein CVT25_003823 [Psilocybe cyanescens]|uniref:Uncharacterized protein n=1 Tax=Psilocybe cyanescens TaxID=93625 RepID=A0A409XU12_PSICY|nr:hypothetical protein CVT25_003823 [Psilocybe cyanescens]